MMSEVAITNFTKGDGNRLTVLLFINWAVSVLLGGAVYVLSRTPFLSTFIIVLATCCGALIVVLLAKRDLLSALLMLGGGLMAFSLTVVLHDALLMIP